MPQPPTTFEEQLGILESRGLSIPDRADALHRLKRANYFRLNCYRHPFLVAGTDQFRPGTRFEDVWQIYRFDHHFRMLMLDAIERCEISFRTGWAYALAHRHGSHAYESPAIHRNRTEHQKTLDKVDMKLLNCPFVPSVPLYPRGRKAGTPARSVSGKKESATLGHHCGRV